jgi:hypothetical protein
VPATPTPLLSFDALSAEITVVFEKVEAVAMELGDSNLESIRRTVTLIQIAVPGHVLRRSVKSANQTGRLASQKQAFSAVMS